MASVMHNGIMLIVPVYQLSAQFPGPTSPREFITLLITSDNSLSDASKVADTTPRHYMVVSIPVSHPEAPPRNGMVRGFYESIEMIREIPLADAGADGAETNPVEWIMVTRSDPGGGIPRFMVERNVPSSIVQDAVKFLDWACAKTDLDGDDNASKSSGLEVENEPDQQHRRSIADLNGVGAGVGTSIADRPSNTIRRASYKAEKEVAGSSQGLLGQFRDSVEAYIPDAINPLQRTVSSSSSSSESSTDSFASASFFPASEGLPVDNDIPTPSTLSQEKLTGVPDDSQHAREMQKIEDKKRLLKEKLDQATEKQAKDAADESHKTQKDMEKAAEKHRQQRKKQEDKFEKEIRKLEERREKETKKLLLRQQKEADKNQLLKAQRERDEHKQKAELMEEENKVLKQQIGDLQRENTALVARLGKTEIGRDILKQVREEDGKGRTRASSRASGKSASVSARSRGESNVSLPTASTETGKS